MICLAIRRHLVGRHLLLAHHVGAVLADCRENSSGESVLELAGFRFAGLDDQLVETGLVDDGSTGVAAQGFGRSSDGTLFLRPEGL